MVDTSMIDLVALIERETGVRFGKAVGIGRKRTRKGPCPWCGGRDHFAVFVNEVPQRFYCGIHRASGCWQYGDAITFMQAWHGVGFFEGCEALGIDPGSTYSVTTQCKKQDEPKPPPLAWQQAALAFCMVCKDELWSEQGLPALRWLRKRGLSDETIKRAGLGYNRVSRMERGAQWGSTDLDGERIWLPRGIVIPWQIDGQLWKVNIRRGDKDIQADLARAEARGKTAIRRKYVQVPGGSAGLYGAYLMVPGEPVVVVEGEFDCLILQQQTHGHVPVVATGSVAAGRAERWVRLIASAEPVLIAFDDDEGGNHAFTSFWSKRIAHAVRWLPWAHDINEMHLAGLDLQQWLSAGLALAQLPSIATAPTAVFQEEQDSLSAVCTVCGSEVERYSPEGIAYCADHFLGDDAPTPSSITYEQFMARVRRIAAVFPGGCTVHVDPPGYTLEEHVRRLLRGEASVVSPGNAGTLSQRVRERGKEDAIPAFFPPTIPASDLEVCQARRRNGQRVAESPSHTCSNRAVASRETSALSERSSHLELHRAPMKVLSSLRSGSLVQEQCSACRAFLHQAHQQRGDW